MEIYKSGWIVAIILAVLTIVEYIFAVEVNDDFIRFMGLTIAALGKAGLIVYYFMHIYRVWSTEEAH